MRNVDVKTCKNTKTFDDNYFDHLKSSDYEKLSVEEQLKRKTEVLETLFNKKDLLPFVKNPKPKGYRHKAVLSAVNIKLEKNYQIRLGLYVEGSKTIKPRLSHMLHHPSIDEMFKTIEKLLIKYKFKAYYAPTRDGIIKHVMIRKSYAFDQYMVVFATNGNLLPNHKLFVQDLIAIHPNIVTVIQNIHHKDTNLVLLEDEKILYGNGYIEDMIDGLTFRISSRSFYQVNPYQMMNLYHKALELPINERSVVLDCYSGIGTLTAAKR